MKDGIYYVTFKSNMQDFGNGTVVAKSNTVNGGDFAYSYKGHVNSNSVSLTIERHDNSVTSVFGNLDSFNLDLSIEESAKGYLLSGNIEGMPQMKITIDAKYIGDLVS
ncbi:GrlR family regulatory protein [Arsenophonus endosymbiont of Crataerina pallida]|uniref:GrlR family regulatory protein n=1 Tax=Arsenophonus endosymbiont of Crataerina pallida TaxID=3066235 RepID=UPI0030D57543